LVGHRNDILALAFSADGKVLASAGKDRTIRLWEVVTGGRRRHFAGHHGEVLCLAFSPDGRALASGSAHTTALVWRLAPCRCPARPAPASALLRRGCP